MDGCSSSTSFATGAEDIFTWEATAAAMLLGFPQFHAALGGGGGHDCVHGMWWLTFHALLHAETSHEATVIQTKSNQIL